MSVAAHKNINQANIASVQLNSEPAVTSISVSARIDYIQRFSKQAVLVIDSDTAVYSQAARQFLINLAQEKSSEDNNVAFVSASTKLNDIQMRCRLIEQLFSNTLFDPEKSLAVSILNLSKKNKEAITIVVEHAHALSLQIKYELCQLVDVANKTQGKINVALFGQEQAGQDVATNKSIFKNKLAIVDARSGQLFSLDHAKFNADNAIFTQKLWLKLAATFVVISALIGLSWFVLINYDNFSLSKVPETTINNRVKQDILVDTKSQVIEKKVQLTKTVIIPEKIEELAKTADIRAALLGEKSVPVNEENPAAQASDILKALDFNESTNASTVITEEAVVTEQEKTILAEVPVLAKNEVVSQSIDEALPLALTPNYYLNSPTGYVVQLVGFTDLTLLKRFMKEHPDLQYFSYQKKLNGQMFIVLTTKIFENKVQAKEAIDALPKTLIDRGIWVKDLVLVKAEINNS
jgi:DamX protein